MSQHVALLLAYEGTHLSGWQKNGELSSVESHLKQALETIVRAPVVLQAASRTDAGVHARGQVVDFFLQEPVCLRRLHRSVNGLLPDSVRVLKAVEVNFPFHPSLDALEKEYHYLVWNHYVQPPHLRLYSYLMGAPLDSALLDAAAHLFVGTHNFEAFCNDRARMVYKDYTRTLTQVTVQREKEHLVRICVRGNRFLFRMVRNIVGVLLACGRGEMSLEQVRALLQGAQRAQASMTVPAHGLFLERIFYKELNLEYI